MPPRGLGEFVEQLARRGELARVSAPVDPSEELAAIVRGLAAQRPAGAAVVFEQVRGRRWPVSAGLLATMPRLLAAVRAESLDELVARRLLPLALPGGWTAAGELLARFAPRLAKHGICQQVVRLGRDIDLLELPGVSFWPAEAPRVLSGGLLLTAAGARVGLQAIRAVAIDRQKLALLSDEAPRGEGDWRNWAQPAPTALVLGGDPAWFVAGSLRLDSRLDGVAAAGMVRGAPLDLVAARSQPLHVPADADLVLEGVLDPKQPPVPVTIGTRGGRHLLTIDAPVMTVSALTHLTHPLVPLVSYDRRGDEAVLTSVLEALVRSVARAVVPGLVDLALPLWGGSGRAVLAAIDKRCAGQGAQSLAALAALPALAGAKLLVAVDAGADLGDAGQLWSLVVANLHAQRDATIHTSSAAPDDHAAPRPPLGSTLWIDATRKLPGEHPRRWPPWLSTDDLREGHVAWEKYGLPRPVHE